MAETLQSLTGTTISISTSTPATEDQLGYEALTYEDIIGVVSFGEWGDTQNDVSEPRLSSGRVIHNNGVKDGGEVTISVQTDPADTGAVTLKATAGTQTSVTIRKRYVNGDAEYAQGVISSVRFREAVNDGIRGFSTTLRVNTAVFEVLSA